MTQDEAAILAGFLIGSTTGWNDDAAETLIANIMHRWPDRDTGREAIDRVVNTWTNPSRPPWGVLAESYRDAARRRALEAVAEIEPEWSRKTVSLERGRAIAARHYELECRRRDPETDVHILSGFRTNEPNPKMVDGLLRGIGDHG